MPTEKSQMEMFQEDLLNSLLGRVLDEPSTDDENAISKSVEDPTIEGG